MDFKSIDDFLDCLQQDINDSLQTDIADGMKQTMCEAIEDVVYSSYLPEIYQRRYESGGLMDKNNMSVMELPNGIAISNDAPFNNEYGTNTSGMSLSEVICTGRGYMYGNEQSTFAVPRDFIGETQQRLDNGIAMDLVKDALIKRDYKVE